MDILEFYGEWKWDVWGRIKSFCQSAQKTQDNPLLYQSNQQQCTSNIIAVDTHIALHIERQFQMVFKRAVEHV